MSPIVPLLLFIASIALSSFSDGSAESACAFASGLLLMASVQLARE